MQELATLDSQVWQFVRDPYNALVWDAERWPDSISTIRNDDQARRYNTLSLIYQWATGAGEIRCWLSSGNRHRLMRGGVVVRIKVALLHHDGPRNVDEFARGSNTGHFIGLAAREEAVIESFDRRGVASGG